MLFVFTDASLHPARTRFGIGAVVINETGQEAAVCAAVIACPAWCTSSIAERHAALEALRFAADLGAAVELRTDDRSLVDLLEGRGVHDGVSNVAELRQHYAAALREWVRRGCVAVRWIPRAENRRADALARWALGEDPARVAPGQLHPVRGEWRQRWPDLRNASAA